MGAWGAGLYSDDFACDLRPAVTTLRRLPLSGDEIVAVLSDLHPAADDLQDEDYPTFWLIVADQLHRAGIASPAASRAVNLIRTGAALAVSKELGMDASELRQREAVLGALADRLEGPLPDKRRSMLKKPQPLLLEPGHVYAYPADSQGNCVNPYFSDAEIDASFEQTCWGSMLVCAAGHEFEFLSWYQLSSSSSYTIDPPTFTDAVDRIDPSLGLPGPLTATQLRRLRLQPLGRIEGFAPMIPERALVIHFVANSISVAGVLSEFAAPGTYPSR